ncbi:MAG: NAD-dependent epimerase/dehydratase family protein [Bacteroidota bacterium]
MQTILGSGGAIGTYLAKELYKYTKNIRLVSRNPKAINPSDHIFPADLTDPEQVNKAIEGSDIVYVVIGFEYKTKIWRETWPKFMDSVISACKKNNAKLVFFDNVYAYDPDYLKGMTEETPLRPISKKGQVRKELIERILTEIKAGQLNAMIVRAPDFLSSHNSVLYETAIKNMKKGKSALWLGDPDKIHNFIYTPDAAKATALLGNTEEAYNQIWHLPTDQTPYTGRQWVEMMGDIIGTKPKIKAVKGYMLGLLGLFKPEMKELKEMNYQFERDYLFDSSKFEKKFKIKPTPAKEALETVIRRKKVESSQIHT